MSAPDSEQPGVELNPTGRVILGMIAFGKRTGYDIKTFVDRTTRYFWAASYGQIYPELKRLEDQGLVRGRPEPSGGRGGPGPAQSRAGGGGAAAGGGGGGGGRV